MGFLFYFYFIFYVFHLLIEWAFGDLLPSLFYSAQVIFMHFLDFFHASMHLRLSMHDESFPFLMNSLLDESCFPLGMMNFGLFKPDAHFFFFSHIDGILFIFPSLVKPYFSWWSLIFSLMNSQLVFHVF